MSHSISEEIARATMSSIMVLPEIYSSVRQKLADLLLDMLVYKTVDESKVREAYITFQNKMDSERGNAFMESLVKMSGSVLQRMGQRTILRFLLWRFDLKNCFGGGSHLPVDAAGMVYGVGYGWIQVDPSKIRASEPGAGDGAKRPRMGERGPTPNQVAIALISHLLVQPVVYSSIYAVMNDILQDMKNDTLQDMTGHGPAKVYTLQQALEHYNLVPAKVAMLKQAYNLFKAKVDSLWGSTYIEDTVMRSESELLASGIAAIFHFLRWVSREYSSDEGCSLPEDSAGMVYGIGHGWIQAHSSRVLEADVDPDFQNTRHALAYYRAQDTYQTSYAPIVWYAALCIKVAYSRAYVDESLAQLLTEAFMVMEVKGVDLVVAEKIKVAITNQISEGLRRRRGSGIIRYLPTGSQAADRVTRWVALIHNRVDRDLLAKLVEGEPTAAAGLISQ